MQVAPLRPARERSERVILSPTLPGPGGVPLSTHTGAPRCFSQREELPGATEGSEMPTRLGPVRDEIQHVFHVRLRSARRTRNLSQVDLARMLKLKPSSISHLERGRALPGLPSFFLLAQALEVSTDFLLGLEDTLNHQEDATFTDLVQAIALMSSDDRELLLRFAERLTAPRDTRAAAGAPNAVGRNARSTGFGEPGALR